MRLARPSSASSLPLAAVCWRRPAGLAPPRVGARHASSSGTPAAAAPSSFDTSVVQDAWDFDADGGLFALSQARAAKAFFREQGFVVFAGVMSAAENAGAVRALIDDLLCHRRSADCSRVAPRTWGRFADDLAKLGLLVTGRSVDSTLRPPLLRPQCDQR